MGQERGRDTRSRIVSFLGRKGEWMGLLGGVKSWWKMLDVGWGGDFGGLWKGRRGGEM